MKKILLIEDNEDILINTAEILELSGYEVMVAANGKLGLETAFKTKPDLIICDIMMPGLDGYGVLHAVHKNPVVRNTPFIFLTAKTERSDFRKGMEMGADDYITKPFTGTELLDAVDSRLKKAEFLRQDYTNALLDLQQLMQTTSGKDILLPLTEGRNINRFKKKQLIYLEGNHPSKLYYILKGKVKAYKSNEDGKELVTELFRPGDFLGYVALLEGCVYKDTASALEDTETAVIPRDDFNELINKNPAIAKKFIQLLAKNVDEKETQLLGLAFNSLRKKVAEALLFLKRKYQLNPDDKFISGLNRENLAMVAGTATESLIRTLSDFRHEKLIEIREGKIFILEEEKLVNMSN